MTEYTPRHQRPASPETPRQPFAALTDQRGRVWFEHPGRALAARLACTDLPPIRPEELDGLADEYHGTYLTVRDAITDLTEADDWQPTLNDLAEATGFRGVFVVDWQRVEEIVRGSFHLIEDDDLVHVFDIGPGEAPASFQRASLMDTRLFAKSELSSDSTNQAK